MLLALSVAAYADEETEETEATEEVTVEYTLAEDGLMTVIPLTPDNIGVYEAEGTYNDDGSVYYEDVEQVSYLFPETYQLGDTILVHVTGTCEDSVRLFLVTTDGTRASEVYVILPGDFDKWIEVVVSDAENKGVTESNQLNFKGSSYGVFIPTMTVYSFEAYSGTAEDYIAAGGVSCGLTGHTITEYVSNGDATCTKDGTKTGICSVCGEEETITDGGSALGHSYTNYISNNDATCTSDGTMTAECDNGCGETDTVTDEGSATGHNYEKGVCTYCGAADPDYSSFPTTTVVIIVVAVAVIAVVVILVVLLGRKKKK